MTAQHRASGKRHDSHNPGYAPDLWRRLVEVNTDYCGAVSDFFAPISDFDRVESVRRGLRAGGVDRATALQVLPCLSDAERWQLFPDLIFLASSAHGSIATIRDAILALPRDKVLANIEAETDSYLTTGSYEEYRRFLELCVLLDRDLTLKLAKRAAAHEDPDIQEAGTDFLESLTESN